MNASRRKFCEGIVVGLTQQAAYSAVYPDAKPDTARKNASHLMERADIKAEVARMRSEADKLGGSAVLTLLEKRIFLARVVRACVAQLDRNSDLWESIEVREDGEKFKLPGKIAAIAADNDLAGQGSDAKADDALAKLLEEIR